MPNGNDPALPVPLEVPPPMLGAGPAGPGAPDDGFDDEEEEGPGIGRYIDAILRRKWLVLGLALVGAAAGFGASRLVAPLYEAQATVHIETTPRGQQPQASPIRTGQLFESRAWIELLRSYRVLDEVVRREKLYLTYPAADSAWFAGFELDSSFTPGHYVLTNGGSGEFVLLQKDGPEVARAKGGEPLGAASGFRWAPPRLPAGRSIAFDVLSLRDAAVQLNSELQALLPPQDGALMRLTMRGTDPHRLAGTLNAVADRFVEVAAELKREKLTAFTEVLEAQLAKSYGELRSAESSLESFRVGTITLPSDRGAAPIAAGLTETRDPVFGAFFQLKLERDALLNQREAIARALRTPSDSSGNLLVSLGAIATVRESAELSATLTDLGQRRAEARRLSLAFTPDHVPLKQLQQEIAEIERGTVREQAQALVDNLDQRIRDYDSRIAASSREIQQIPPRVSEEARRRRDVEIATNLYTSLQSAYESAKLAELSASPDVRVLDTAVPPRTPVRDQMLIILAGGLVGGLGLGIALALLLDRFDTRIRYPDQVTRGLRLGILGALPVVRERKGKPDADGEAHLLEALRTIRMNMVYAHGTAGTFVTTITSPGSGEGKSFLSSNLARSFAAAGRRTLVIDGDTRRGALHKTFGVQRRPGLLDVLSGSATLEQAVQTIPDRGIDFIACGTRRTGGPELLGSTAMAQLLMGLRQRYSVILIDSPPLGAGVDALVLASLAGSMVLVLRNGVSDRDLAAAKLQDLQRLPVRTLGAVLNDVVPSGVYRYYSYLPGYGAGDEGDDDGEARPASKRKSGWLIGKG